MCTVTYKNPRAAACRAMHGYGIHGLHQWYLNTTYPMASAIYLKLIMVE